MKTVPKNICLKSSSTGFPGAQSAPFPALSSPWGLKACSCSSTGSVFAEADGNHLVSQSLASALGKCVCVVDRPVPVWS